MTAYKQVYKKNTLHVRLNTFSLALEMTECAFSILTLTIAKGNK